MTADSGYVHYIVYSLLDDAQVTRDVEHALDGLDSTLRYLGIDRDLGRHVLERIV